MNILIRVCQAGLVPELGVDSLDRRADFPDERRRADSLRQ